MKLKDLIGKSIVDIFVRLELEPNGLDKADSFILLDNGVMIGIPFNVDDGDAWTRELDKSAISLFKPDKWLPTADNSILTLKNCKIVDILSYPDETEKALILLDNQKLITEINFAPHGSGQAGFWCYNTLSDVEKEYGQKYIRLSDFNGSA